MRIFVHRLLAIIVSLLLPFGASAMELSTKCANGVFVSAKVDPLIRDFFLGSKLPHVSGSVRLLNNSQATVTFSTAKLMLSTEGSSPKRAYINSVASQAADFSPVEVPKGQSVELDVYWPVSLEVGVTAKGVVLSCAG